MTSDQLRKEMREVPWAAAILGGDLDPLDPAAAGILLESLAVQSQPGRAAFAVRRAEDGTWEGYLDWDGLDLEFFAPSFASIACCLVLGAAPRLPAKITASAAKTACADDCGVGQ